MGACLSCLGLARRESSSEPSDTHPLLNEPYPPNHYGAIGDNPRSSPRVDPEEIRKQRDALERLCATTSDKLIDVTHTTRTSTADILPTKMVTDYARLFAEQFGDDRPESASTQTSEQENVDALRRTLKKEGKELATWRTPKDLGALSVQFDDIMALPAGNGKGKVAY